MANQTFTSPSPLYFENSTKFEIVSSSKSHESNYYLLHSMEKNSLQIFISILGIIFFSLAIMFYIYYYRKYNRKSSNVNQQRDEMFKYSNVRSMVEKKNFVGQLINKVKCRILLKTEVAAVSEIFPSFLGCINRLDGSDSDSDGDDNVDNVDNGSCSRRGRGGDNGSCPRRGRGGDNGNFFPHRGHGQRILPSSSKFGNKDRPDGDDDEDDDGCDTQTQKNKTTLCVHYNV
ncbi:hypothetical protein DERF_009752 [Dermatophagoides farinae]|uniref:Uncharacterized protein n=1 Tax=Dermatophagoides farinae TaxID=6954 RepID=A0A922L181_DERFA|nr:hypothetical protein DERF_009752 [Dermatophagoides farinae]